MKPQLAVIRGCVINPENNGRLVEIICRVSAGVAWTTSSGEHFYPPLFSSTAVRSLGKPFLLSAGALDQEGIFIDRVVFPINGDQPGNEYSFKAAPKSLPATTKGDTITERGELA